VGPLGEVENVGEHRLAASSYSFTLLLGDGDFGEACTPWTCAKDSHSSPGADIALASIPARSQQA
jgi:hypothetical protein